MNYGNAILVSCIAIILTWGWKLLNWAWLNPKKLEKQLREQGLNGNSYRFLYGDSIETFDMREEARQKPIPFTHDFISRILPFLHQQVAKYGENCITWMGPTPTINITQPELIREVLTRIDEFQKPRTANPLIALLVPGLVSLEGEKWAMHRKLINPAFHTEKLKLMLPAFRASVTELTDKWEKSVPETGSSELNIWPDISNLTATVISRAAFGSSFEDGRRIFELQREQTQITIQLFRSIYIPGWNYVPTKINKQMKKINADIQNLVKGIIDKRRKAIDAGEAAKDDLLGIFMDSNMKETLLSKSKRPVMSLKDMIDECKLFYFAGQETTSVLLTWTLILLSKHQDWQIKARHEIMSCFGNNLPDVDGANHLKIVTTILYEVLRLYPPAISVARQIHDKDTMLANLCVPKGALVNLSIYEVHHDPKHWGDDANEFKPDRFSEGILNATNGKLAYFPFIGGPRICMGQGFTLLEAKIVLSTLLQRFSFQLSPSYAHAPTAALTLQPQFGAHLIVRRL